MSVTVLDRRPAVALVVFWLAGAMLAPASPAGAATATGKVAVEGSLSTNHFGPVEAGTVFFIYFNATPLEDLPQLELRIELPDGLEPAAGTEAEMLFQDVEEGRTVTLTATVRVRRPGTKTVVAQAVLVESEDFVEARSFVLEIGAEPSD